MASLFILQIGAYFSRGWMILWLTTTAMLLPIWRWAFGRLLGRLSSAGRIQRCRLALIGATEQARRLFEQMDQDANTMLYDVVGVFDDRLGSERLAYGSFVGHPLLGRTSDLKQLVRAGSVDAIMIALPHAAAERIRALATTLSEVPADLLLGPDLASMMLRPRRRNIADIWDCSFIKLYEQPFKGWSGIVKWLQDKVIASMMLLFLSPLILLIAFAIKLDSRGSIFFCQERFGFNNNPIRVIKFRTMYQDQGDLTGTQCTVRNDPRVTRIGRILRRSSLDELPQLLNVLKGDMSLVGPRAHALSMKAANQYYHEAVQAYAARHRVKPGITGLAQVNGLRGGVGTLEKAKRRIEYDLEYIENWSIWMDFRIICKTILQLPFDQNAY
jgi:Undecaprenyl-phosphate glucose phosphotransferase